MVIKNATGTVLQCSYTVHVLHFDCYFLGEFYDDFTGAECPKGAGASEERERIYDIYLFQVVSEDYLVST